MRRRKNLIKDLWNNYGNIISNTIEELEKMTSDFYKKKLYTEEGTHNMGVVLDAVKPRVRGDE